MSRKVATYMTRNAPARSFPNFAHAWPYFGKSLDVCRIPTHLNHEQLVASTATCIPRERRQIPADGSDEDDGLHAMPLIRLFVCSIKRCRRTTALSRGSAARAPTRDRPTGLCARRLHPRVSARPATLEPPLQRFLTLSRRPTSEESLHADVFIEIRPMDSLAGSYEPPLAAFTRAPVGQARIPAQRYGHCSPIGQIDDKRITRNPDGNCQRLDWINL